MKTIYQITLACFIGGALCAAVAASVAPQFLWLATLAGIAGGYFGYESRQALTIVPRALHFAGIRAPMAVINSIVVFFRGVVRYFCRKHPFMYAGAVLALAVLEVVNNMFTQFLGLAEEGISQKIQAAKAFCIFVILTGVLSLPFVVLAWIGSNHQKKYWWPPARLYGIEDGSPPDWQELQHREQLLKEGYSEEKLGYGNAYRWMVYGALIVLYRTPRAIFWDFPRVLGVGLFRFTWYLFKQIHCRERVLCALDGTIGGLIAFWLGGNGTTTAGYVLLILSGGLIGAGLGVLSYKLISVRLLKLCPAT
ncbi:MAG: hypothetical protein RL150_610 [Candidatus Parcubacteria bacterium]|jgi:hypothetical protein